MFVYLSKVRHLHLSKASVSGRYISSLVVTTFDHLSTFVALVATTLDATFNALNELLSYLALTFDPEGPEQILNQFPNAHDV
jgi:hypothetical protein